MGSRGGHGQAYLPVRRGKDDSARRLVARMIRVLHLVEGGADFQTGRSVRQLAQVLGGGFEGEVRTLGARGDWTGITNAVMGLRRIVEFDGVHAWGVKALTAAAL